MAIVADADKIRNQLLKHLQNEEVDYGRILELSLELSELDEENVRFSVDASHMSRLGRELVGKKETAVSELVKNAYDADATQVTLTFENADLAGGRLTIEDDGNGMTREQLIAGFMRLSTTDKIHEPYSPKYNRLRAGRKGIGRFAAQGLGKKLTITTQIKKSDVALQVEIDWAKFKADKDLIIISNQIKEVEKLNNQGTRLIIDNLEDGWTTAAIEKVYKYIVDLIQPFPISKALEVDTKDPGFEVKIFSTTNDEKIEVASAEKLIYEYALAEINAKVDNNGKGRWSIKSKQHEINDKGLSVTPKDYLYPHIRNVNVKAYYYIYSSDSLPRNIIRQIRELANERAGIRVYRNGFRVLPYGESNDDWLHLDERHARREILPPFRNQNFFGFVELIDPKGVVFEETASREGLIETEGFKELVSFVGDVLEAAVLRVAEARQKKAKPTKSNVTPTEKIQRAVEVIRRAKSDLDNSLADKNTKRAAAQQASVAKVIQDAVKALEEGVSGQQEREEDVLNELSMLRVLASLGLSIGQFNHEIRNMFPALLADTHLLISLTSGDVHEKAIRLKKNIQSFRTYTSYFDKSVSDNARRETVVQDVVKILRSFWEVITPACERRDIEFPEPTIHKFDLFTTPMHSSEWTSILFNLFTNSRKAIVRAKSAPGRILMIAGREKNNIYVDFADNGDGIPRENQERIFDAFFTTSYIASSDGSTNDDEDDDLLGTGLGLKILKDIVTSYGGEITLVGAPRGYSTCFRIEIPAASKEQLEAYGY